MKKGYIILSLFILTLGCKEANYLQEADVKLGVPYIIGAGDFIRDNAKATILAPLEGCIVYYRTNGEDAYEVYSDPIDLTGISMIEAKAVKSDYKESEVILQRFLNVSQNKVEGIESTTLASPSYPGNGPLTLSDMVKGSTDFKDGNWLGYQADTISYTVDIMEAEKGRIILSLLQNQDNWIFLPKSIWISWTDKVTGLSEKKNVELSQSDIKDESGFEYIEFSLDGVTSNTIIIDVLPLSEIPNWHAGKGSKPWLFIDEILVL